MKIDIRTQVGTGRTYSFDVQPNTTIKEIKRLILEKTNNDENELKNMYLTFEIDILDQDEATLQSYGVEHHSELVLHHSGRTYRNLGAVGLRFTDVSNTKGLKRCEWSKTAPAWRRARRGLCFEGKCDNEKCEAYTKNVVMGIGYCKFDVMTDIGERTTYCPQCGQYIEPDNCGFNNCWWRFEGRKRDGNDSRKAPQECSTDWQQVDNAYHYFDQPMTGMVTWLKLIIEVVKDKPVEHQSISGKRV